MRHAIVGRPGSLRRWLLGSVLWLTLCVLAFVFTANFYVIVVAVLADAAAFFARDVLIGDEDEFNAELARSMLDAAKGQVPSFDDPSDPSEWLTRTANRFRDAPAPPCLEEVQAEPDVGGWGAGE